MDTTDQQKNSQKLYILKKLYSAPKVKYIFCDFFDTIVHRNTHPNYSFKLWAKHLIRELGIVYSAKDFGQIRLNSMRYVAQKNKKKAIEIAYEEIMEEVYHRLVNNNLFPFQVSFNQFLTISKAADYRAEISVQFLNTHLLEELKILKSSGYTLFLVSDFFLPKEVMQKLVEYHNLSGLFSELYISCSVEESKEQGGIYPLVLKDTHLRADQVVMIGDNKLSDSLNAEKYGILSIHLKHQKHIYRNKWNLLGSDHYYFNSALKKIEKECQKSEFPYSEYILFFTVFIERLYKESKSKGIKNLFFLAREGAYLKKLFDAYQERMNLDNKSNISTHYFKASRQSAMQIALKELHLENFTYLKSYGKMSASSFLQNFLFNEKLISAILLDAGIEENIEHPNFILSEDMNKLKKSSLFKHSYESNRISQKKYFLSYIKSFGVAIEKEGITVVDVGWGGSMQEWLFEFFEGQVNVEGYYVGLKQIYNITEQTKRWGLNFTLYPENKPADILLMANTQLYEQLLSASHGSTLGYCDEQEGFTVEYHQENEKWAYETIIQQHQKYMFEQFHNFLNLLEAISYEKTEVQKNITDLTLRVGLFPSIKKLHFFQEISKAFYQNIGNNTVGIAYDPNKISISKKKLGLDFLIFPEKTFKYIVKLKPFIYSKKGKFIAWLVTPLMYFIYYYIKGNNFLRTKLLDKVNL